MGGDGEQRQVPDGGSLQDRTGLRGWGRPAEKGGTLKAQMAGRLGSLEEERS